MRPFAILALATVLSAGCFTHRPTFDAPPRDAWVSVDFRTPTRVPVFTLLGDTVLLDSVTELRGRVDWVTADTIYLRLTGASGSSRAVRGVPQNGLVAVVRHPSVVIQRREFHAGRTAALALGTAAVGALLWGIAFVVSVALQRPG